jgi:peptidyl-prolyl cis-trans isomerase B (cyclophilin B)
MLIKTYNTRKYLCQLKILTKIEMLTSKGKIVLDLNEKLAPKTVANFIAYVKSGHYEKTIFHRVIDGFMIQGGGFDEKMNQKSVNSPIEIESNTGLKNTKGTIAMARTGDPNSATSQFFINTTDNPFLNYTSDTPQGYGYAVFGQVIEGMNVVNEIKAAKTGTKGGHSDVPDSPIMIEKVTILE